MYINLYACFITKQMDHFLQGYKYMAKKMKYIYIYIYEN